MAKLTKAQQRENIAVAYSIIGGIPDKHFHLQQFCSIDEPGNAAAAAACGTIGCSLGWLAMHPYFMAQGLLFDNGIRLTQPNGRVIYDVDSAATILFGRDAFERYFNTYGFGRADNLLTGDRWERDNTEQKRLALARLKRGYDLMGRATQVRTYKKK